MLKVQLELAEPPEETARLEGEHDIVKPDGLATSARDTLPAKPPRLVMVKVDDPVLPVWKPTVAGFAVIE